MINTLTKRHILDSSKLKGATSKSSSITRQKKKKHYGESRKCWFPAFCLLKVSGADLHRSIYITCLDNTDHSYQYRTS